MSADQPPVDCGTCQHWHGQTGAGDCHRYPPVRIPESNGWHWPETWHHEVCGEHKPMPQEGDGDATRA